MLRSRVSTAVLALSVLTACGHAGESVGTGAGDSARRAPIGSAAGPLAGSLAGSLAGPASAGDTETADDASSTFALDVDTASYDYAARALADGRLPDPASVRPEEFVNTFEQGYAEPDGDGFAVHVDGAELPFVEDAGTHVLRVGLQTRSAEEAARRDATLTFVVDVSGSMSEPGRLDLVRQALHTLVDRLRGGDSVGIVAYSSSARVVSPVRPVTEAADLDAAIDALRPDASTNLEAGLMLGYEVARSGYRSDTTNRVVLLTDGLANTGSTSADDILAEVHEQASDGIALLTVGVGSEYGDALMERLADRGDGITAYVRNAAQATDVFLHRLPATADLRAADAKARVRFDPAAVSSYRLIGYDDRAVADDDFRNDAVDGGEVGAGHSVTALYAVRLRAGAEGDVATATVRWQDPGGGGTRETSRTVSVEDISGPLVESAPRLQLDVVAATFAQQLRGVEGAWSEDLASLAGDADRVAALLEEPAVADLATLVHAAAQLSSGSRQDPGSLPRW